MESPQGIWLLYSTFAKTDEAISAAEALLAAGHIACANVLPGALSLYRWEGELRREPEAVLIAKTTAARKSAAIAALKAAHPYELPGISAWKLDGGHAPFFDWIRGEVRG